MERSHDLYVTQGADGSTSIWDVRTGECEMKYMNHEAGVNAVKFSPNGDEVATAGNDGTVTTKR